MVPKLLSGVVKAVRLRYAIPFVLLLSAIYWIGIYPWMTTWGSTVVEQQMSLPGAELNSDRTGKSTWAITIHAPADVVWQWLIQIGQDRAGFYTYTWLENIFGADIHNTDEIRPEWQQQSVGDGWRLLPPDYLWGLGKEAVMPVQHIEPGKVLEVEMFGAHVILPIGEHATRLIVRGEWEPGGALTKLLAHPVIFTMERRMLLGLKARAEGRPDAPAVLMAIAHLGWAAACFTIAGLFLVERRRRYWLALPIAAALPALLMAHDFQAALAAFIAVGFTLLGFLIFGRSWWGAWISMGSIVLLTLLLAPEAYTAIGLASYLFHLGALGLAVASSRKTVRHAGERLATPVP